MKSFVLFLNGDLGLKVLRYVITQDGVEINGIVLNSIDKRSAAYFGQVTSLLNEFGENCPIISYTDAAGSCLEIVDLIHGSDYGISALFGHILPSAWLESTHCEIINLHPSFLPIGRGADPIPWSIIDKQKQGVTLHIINSGLDTGPILSQKEIPTNIGMNAGEIYETAIEVLYKELENVFYSWINGAVELKKQPNSTSLTRKSQDLESIRVLKLDEIATFAEFLRKLQALTFSDSRRPLFVDESGRLWKVEVWITPEI